MEGRQMVWLGLIVTCALWIGLVCGDEIHASWQRLLDTKAFVEVAAESAVHLSTYGAILVGFLLEKGLNFKPEPVGVAVMAVVWFAAFSSAAYRFRVLLGDLRD
jgi:hypothetical protein